MGYLSTPTSPILGPALGRLHSPQRRQVSSLQDRDPPKSLSIVNSPGPSCLLAQGVNIFVTVLLTSALPFYKPLFFCLCKDSHSLPQNQPATVFRKKNIYIYTYIYIFPLISNDALYFDKQLKKTNKTHKPDPRLYNSIWCLEKKNPSRRNLLL